MESDAGRALLRFCRSVRFTAFTERFGDERTVVVLASFRTRVREIAARRGVRVTKWLGDGAMLSSVRHRGGGRHGDRAGRHRGRPGIPLESAAGPGPGPGHHVRGRRLHRPGHQRGVHGCGLWPPRRGSGHPGGRQPVPPLGRPVEARQYPAPGLRPAPRSRRAPDRCQRRPWSPTAAAVWCCPPSPASTPASAPTAAYSASARPRAPCPGSSDSASSPNWSGSTDALDVRPRHHGLRVPDLQDARDAT